MKLTALKLVFILIAATSLAAELPPLIPMKDFFRNSEKTNYRLSPDGNHIAHMAPWKNRLNVFVQKVGEKEVTQVTYSEERDINAYGWSNNTQIAFIQDKGGDENYHFFVADIFTGKSRNLTPFEKTKAHLVDRLKNDDEHMLILHNQRDKRYFDAYRINTLTGKSERVVENPGIYTGYVTDHEGRIRIAVSRDGVKTGIFYRADEEAEFQKIIETDFRESIKPLFFTFDNQKLYAASNINRDKAALVIIDPQTGQEEEILFQHPEVDVSSLIRSDKYQKILGVAYQTAKSHYHFMDPDYEKLHTRLQKQLPGKQITITSHNRNEDRYIVVAYSDRDSGTSYFYNASTEELTLLSKAKPWLDEKHLARVKPIQYTSRDGLTIHGYLTLPQGVPAQNLPLIVNPHGGPQLRDHWGFSSGRQFLANRGYAVLQVNFRGSTGYGRKFQELGFKQWGKNMQNDITDGAHWAIAEGIADPKRIAIYGASYGGYATLAGLTFTPDLYACGVDYVGVSNLLTFLNSLPPYWENYRAMLYETVGNPETEEELLRAASPLFHADKIKVPLFIAQGANDPRVVKAESDQMVEALKKRGIEVPYMVKDDEGHGFRKEENRFDFYRAMEKFLAKHIGGRTED